MVGLLFYTGWSGTLSLQWTLGKNEEVRSGLCGYLEGAHLRLKKSQVGSPKGSKLMKPSKEAGVAGGTM